MSNRQHSRESLRLIDGFLAKARNDLGDEFNSVSEAVSNVEHSATGELQSLVGDAGTSPKYFDDHSENEWNNFWLRGA